MPKIELKNYELCIKTLPTGQEVAQIQPRVAFNEEFIADLKANGVKEYQTAEQREKEEDEEEDEE